MKDKSIIKNVIDNLIEKLEKAVENFHEFEIVFDQSNDHDLKKNPFVLISFMDLEEIININFNEKILIEEKNREAELKKFYIKPPFEYNLKFLITVFHKSRVESCMMLENIAKIFKNDSNLQNQKSLVKENNKRFVFQVIHYDIIKLGEIFKILNMQYNPSIVLQTKIEIENDYREEVKTVIKRNFYVIENKRNLK